MDFGLCLLLALSLFFASFARAADTNGFAVKFASTESKATDFIVLPNLWLFVEKGAPPTPFLPAGPFTAEFNGFISAELRATYFFKAEQLNGAFKLEINGTTVLDLRGNGGASEISKGIQLNKGPNAIKATYTSAAGDAFVRIGWTEKGTNVYPIPAAWITQARTPELQNAERVSLGRELFLEYRCTKCHAEKFSTPVPELAMDAPAFEAIGLRCNVDWLAKWILDPKATRALVQMPKMLHGQAAQKDAEAIAIYLASLKTKVPVAVEAQAIPFGNNPQAFAEIDKRSGAGAKPTLGDPSEQPEAPAERKPLFDKLHCTGCHNAPNAKEVDATKISLKHVAEKFAAGQLAEFLKAPERHFAWIRMPNFKLSDVEVRELSDYLAKVAEKPKEVSLAGGSQAIEQGKKLVQTLGCLNCHSGGDLENQFAAPAANQLPAGQKGCLAEKHLAGSKAPDFGFDTAEREALIAFLRTDRSSLARHSPMEFAARQARVLQCNACHGQIDLVPPMEILGGKLKPEWSATLMAGQIFKVRADIHPKGGDWVPARMPAFKVRAKLLAQGLAEQQGYPPVTPSEPPLDEAAAKVGLKLSGKDNGLSCISCHAVNDMPALEVFESEGINLGLSGSRLLKPYFFRWMRNPLSIDPQTKMPAFFPEEGLSPLTDYYEGDGEKQINALYNFMRLGEKMPKPSAGQ